MTEFPGNSKHPQPGRPEKKVEQVVTNDVVARKKSLGKRLKDMLIGGDSKTVVQYVISEVLIPQAKDMITEGVSSGFEKLIYGDSRPHRRFGTRHGGPANYTNYNRYASRGNNPIGRSIREDRTPTASVQNHGIDDILFATRVEAETVLERLYDLLREYESASVSDLYSLIGWSSSFVDQKWGWTELHGSSVQRVRDGYLLNLPKPQNLD